ncbi:MAG: alkaline phosphatase family protein [Gemmatimonadota bacterium]
MTGWHLRAAAALLLLAGCGREPVPRLLVLGIDGMDPQILQRLMDQGRLPHFQALAARGGCRPLQTTMPPQSPVAWSTFITGLPPAGHGIFDFVHRDPATLTPYLSTARRNAAGHLELQRHGTPFWELLHEHGIPVTIFKVPANFPSASVAGGLGAVLCACQFRAFSGMGTPDLLGTYGTFTLYTDGPYTVPPYLDEAGQVLLPGGELEIAGGRIVSVSLQEGGARLAVRGPTLAEDERAAGIEIAVDRAAGAVRLDAGGQSLVLQPGEWSDWLRLDFGRTPGRLSRVTGIARLYLESLQPHLRLYLSPVNIDPANPLMPVSQPGSAAADLAAAMGPYYTQGMPADTKALEAEALDYGTFLEQLDFTVRERERQLDLELARFDGGVLFFYVHSLDQICHMLWRAADPRHPGHTREMAVYGNAIDAHYERLDRLLGRAVAAVGPGCDVLVLSDHGFAAFERTFNLNTWLAREGYLSLARLTPADRPSLLADGQVRWADTRAYSLGLNALYLNLAGREGRGAVGPADAGPLLEAIEAGLLALRDPATGRAVVAQVYRTVEAAAGFPDLAPDLLVGYARGYRCSGASALGRLEPEILADNLSPWSGDHCMAAAEVPGVLVTSRPLAGGEPGLADIPVTILDYYGIAPPPGMAGHPAWVSPGPGAAPR